MEIQKVNPYSGSGDVQIMDFLKNFEELINANKLDEYEAARLFPLYLEGAARKWFHSKNFHRVKKLTYNHIKTKILQRFNPKKRASLHEEIQEMNLQIAELKQEIIELRIKIQAPYEDL